MDEQNIGLFSQIGKNLQAYISLVVFSAFQDLIFLFILGSSYSLLIFYYNDLVLNAIGIAIFLIMNSILSKTKIIAEKSGDPSIELFNKEYRIRSITFIVSLVAIFVLNIVLSENIAEYLFYANNSTMNIPIMVEIMAFMPEIVGGSIAVIGLFFEFKAWAHFRDYFLNNNYHIGSNPVRGAKTLSTACMMNFVYTIMIVIAYLLPGNIFSIFLIMISGLLLLVGSIVHLVGFSKLGSALTKLSYERPYVMQSSQHQQYSYNQPPPSFGDQSVNINQNEGSVGQNSSTSKFCTNCGKSQPDGIKFCTQCGSPISQ